MINGGSVDLLPMQIGNNTQIKYAEHLEILGSHISNSLMLDLQLHFKKRFKNVIKFFNYVKTNEVAPITVKLKVLKSCVVTTLLYNCEAFGFGIPDGLEEIYYKMLRAALGVRSNCPKLLLLIESGFLPIKCLIELRQLKFFRRFKKSLQPNGTRSAIFSYLLANRTSFIDHYVQLDNKYATGEDLVAEYCRNLKSKIRDLGRDKDVHYKYWIYLQLNPELTKSTFLNRIDAVGKGIVKFRLGSHQLKIETGRWSRTPRENRTCVTCGELGDEEHMIYSCADIVREDLVDIPRPLSSLWDYQGVNRLFKRIMDAEYLV